MEVTKTHAWDIKLFGVDAASQQTLFIVSGSPSNTMLGEVTKTLCLECKSCGVDAALQQTYFIVGTSGNPIREGRIDPLLKGRAYLTF